MKKRLLMTALTLIMSISIVGCSTPPQEKSNNQPLKSITIGVMPDLDSLPIIIAAHNEYFKEEGMDVKIEHFKSAAR